VSVSRYITRYITRLDAAHCEHLPRFRLDSSPV
jgi:hypothetical protein